MKQENPICGVYQITSPKKRIYIGGSIDTERRKGEYSRLECKVQIRLYNSLKKHGWKNHKFEIIHLCKEKLLNELEMHYIKLFDTFNTPHGLNLTKGGEGASGYKHTEKAIEVMHQANSGENNPFYDKIHTKKTLKLMSQAKLGKNHPMYNKHHTEKTKESLRKIWTVEKREEFGKSLSGKNHPMYGKVGHMKDKHHTKEAKEKNRQSHLGKISPQKGKTWEELYGAEKATKMKQDLREAKLGKTNSLKGKTFEEIYGVEKASEMRERMIGNIFGKRKLIKAA